MGSATKRLYRRAWAIGRQIQHRQRTSEPILPVSPQPLAIRPPQEHLLPADIVVVLLRYRRENGGSTMALSLVAYSQFVYEKSQGPEIGYDMMYHQQHD